MKYIENDFRRRTLLVLLAIPAFVLAVLECVCWPLISSVWNEISYIPRNCRYIWREYTDTWRYCWVNEKDNSKKK